MSAVQAIRDAKGDIKECYSIFSYGFPKAKAMFNAEIPFKEKEMLSLPCFSDSIIRYPELIKYGIEKGIINKSHEELLHVWSNDPEKWSNDWKEKRAEEKV